MWVDGLNAEMLFEEQRRSYKEKLKQIEKKKAYISGVKQGYSKKYKGNQYEDYQDQYIDGLIVGMGMNLFQYIKFLIQNSNIET